MTDTRRTHSGTRPIRMNPAAWLQGAARRIAPALISAAAAVLLTACASIDPDCPASGAALPPDLLYGTWEARVGDAPGPSVVLQLQPHPDYAGVRGQVLREGSSAQVAGDVNDQGLLLLDESQDGQRISAVWEGELQPRSCASRFHGQWRRAGDASSQPFVLSRKSPTP